MSKVAQCDLVPCCEVLSKSLKNWTQDSQKTIYFWRFFKKIAFSSELFGQSGQNYISKWWARWFASYGSKKNCFASIFLEKNAKNSEKCTVFTSIMHDKNKVVKGLLPLDRTPHELSTNAFFNFEDWPETFRDMNIWSLVCNYPEC